MRQAKRFLTGLAAGVLAFAAHADTVLLTDGTEIVGKVLEDNASTVVIRRENGVVVSVRKADVDAVVYDERKPVEVPAAPAVAETPAAPAADVKPGAEAPKPAAGAKTDKAEEGAKPAADGKGGEKKEEKWTAPPNLPGFPENAKRMAEDREAQFMNLLAQMDVPSADVRSSVKQQMIGMGQEALPYLVAAAQHNNVEARAAAMDAIGQLDPRAAVKNIIELTYAAIPNSGEPATWQTPYLRACKSTMNKATDQSFIVGEPSSALIQDGVRRAIEWYNQNMDRLPAQLGDPKIEKTDPEYMEKLKKARALKLVKREYPRPPLSADIVQQPPKAPGRTPFTEQDTIRSNDRSYGNEFKPQNRDDALQRGNERQRPADPRDRALDRR